MRWGRWAVGAALIGGGAVLALWQYLAFEHERALIQETLHQQSHSVMNTLVGGIRSHRRLGCFFEEQLAGMLDEVAHSNDVLAVAVASSDGRLILSAGTTDSLPTGSALTVGEFWGGRGFRCVESFSLLPTVCPACPEKDSAAEKPAAMAAAERPKCCLKDPENRGPFADGGEFLAIVLLDRSRADTLCRAAIWSHTSVAAAGMLVVICIAAAWRASMRLVEAHARARVLEAETRHLRELSQAAAGLAHDTRNPLGLIRGWTQRLSEKDSNGQQRRAQAQAVMEECDRITARINQFLAFARPCRLSRGPVDLARIVEELATILQPDLEAKHLKLESHLRRSCGPIQADRELLRQALFNLLQNAVQFSPPGGTIVVGFGRSSNGFSRVEIADGGPGVAPEKVDSLFMPYFTTRPDGTGMGLAIVRRIATAHGWTVGYHGRAGGGAVFFLDGLHG